MGRGECLGAFMVPWGPCRECTSGKEAMGCQYGIKMCLEYTARPGKLSHFEVYNSFHIATA